MAGIGAIIRDSAGNDIIGMAANIGVASKVDGEIWAIREGLKLALQNKITTVHKLTFTVFLTC